MSSQIKITVSKRYSNLSRIVLTVKIKYQGDEKNVSLITLKSHLITKVFSPLTRRRPDIFLLFAHSIYSHKSSLNPTDNNTDDPNKDHWRLRREGGMEKNNSDIYFRDLSLKLHRLRLKVDHPL